MIKIIQSYLLEKKTLIKQSNNKATRLLINLKKHQKRTRKERKYAIENT